MRCVGFFSRKMNMLTQWKFCSWFVFMNAGKDLCLGFSARSLCLAHYCLQNSSAPILARGQVTKTPFSCPLASKMVGKGRVLLKAFSRQFLSLWRAKGNHNLNTWPSDGSPSGSWTSAHKVSRSEVPHRAFWLTCLYSFAVYLLKKP